MKIISGELELVIPDNLEPLEGDAGDPPGTVCYGLQNSNTQNFMLIFPIAMDKAMPIDAPRIIIDCIHDGMGENQGLIKVGEGYTRKGKKYVYSIVKSGMEPSGVQYILILQIHYPHSVLNIQSYYNEIGITGMRDAKIYEKAKREGKLTGDFGGWAEDPYDPADVRGLRMNLSESEEYDEMFPEHPLSVLRSFVDEVLRNN